MSFYHSRIKMGRSHISTNNDSLVLLQNHIDYSHSRIEIYDTTRCIRISWHWKLILSHHRRHARRDAWRRVRMGPYRDPHVLLPLSAMGINQSISPLARPPLTTSGRSWGRCSDRGADTSRSISINPLSQRLLFKREEKRGREVISSSFIEKARVYAPWTTRVSRSQTIISYNLDSAKNDPCAAKSHSFLIRAFVKKYFYLYIFFLVCSWLAIAINIRKISICHYN